MARGYLKWSARELARAAEVSSSTVKRIESDEFGPERASLHAVLGIVAALEASGIVFIPADETGGAGVRLKD